MFHDTIDVKYQDGEIETLPITLAKDKVYKCQNNCGHEHGNLEDLKESVKKEELH